MSNTANTSEANLTQTESTNGATAAQSKLSGLKAPSKIVRPSIPKPTSTTVNSSLAAKNSSVTNSNSSLNTANTNLNTTDAHNNENENINDFKVNERVWVNGTKPGTLAFIGEAQFKEGVWAGVILDTAEGKNNGTVGGVTYFKTDENRGVFCRLNKLTRSQVIEGTQSGETSANTTIQQDPSAASINPDIKIGSRVYIKSIDGTIKIGVLRFMGTTDFGKGEWAGVELDEKLGKNDGSVGNKRYFQCEAMHGLFAPLQKVNLYSGSEGGASKVAATPAAAAAKSKLQTLQATSTAKLATPATSRTSIGVASKSRLSKQLSGSQESLISEKSSIYSTASGVAKAQQASKLLAKPTPKVVC